MEYSDLKKGMILWFTDFRYDALKYVKKTKVLSFNENQVVLKQGLFSEPVKIKTDYFLQHAVEV